MIVISWLGLTKGLLLGLELEHLILLFVVRQILVSSITESASLIHYELGALDFPRRAVLR